MQKRRCSGPASPNTEEEKKALLDLALTWTQAAALSEKSVGSLRA